MDGSGAAAADVERHVCQKSIELRCRAVVQMRPEGQYLNLKTQSGYCSSS